MAHEFTCFDMIFFASSSKFPMLLRPIQSDRFLYVQHALTSCYLIKFQAKQYLPRILGIFVLSSLTNKSFGLPDLEGPTAGHLPPLVPKASPASPPDHQHRRGVCENPAAHASLYVVGRCQHRGAKIQVHIVFPFFACFVCSYT